MATDKREVLDTPEGGVEYESIPVEHPISNLANNIYLRHEEMATAAGLSRWDFCVALANSIGFILASSKDMPREHAMKRFDGLHNVMKSAYELHGTQGNG